MNIIVRPARADDLDMAKSLALPYAAPDWDTLEVSAVIERDGEPSAAVFLRRTAETYLLLNPELQLRKRDRIADLLILHKELVKPALRAGFSDIHCWVPPELEAQHFGRLLLHLGWTKPLWSSYSRKVE